MAKKSKKEKDKVVTTTMSTLSDPGTVQPPTGPKP